MKVAICLAVLAAFALTGCTKTKIKDSTVETTPGGTVVVPDDNDTTIIRP